MFDPASGKRELFDIANDPEEAIDIVGSPELLPLLAAMETWISETDPLPSEEVVAPDIKAQLEALGYVE